MIGSRCKRGGLIAAFFAFGLAGASCVNDLTVLGRATSTDSAPNPADNLDAGVPVDYDGGLVIDDSAVGQTCLVDTDCDNSIGAACVNSVCTLARTCAEFKSRDLVAEDGVYTIDVDGPEGPLWPFPVFCDMTTDGGGWTRVGFEPAGSGGDHIQGSLVYLGDDIGRGDAVANGTGSGFVGARFNGQYSELAITWGADYARMTVTQDIFINTVATAIPVTSFVTSDATLAGWVTAAGGAVFCRASRATDVRPGDTSWAIKPMDSKGTGCGCDDPTSRDRGAFYGGVLQATSCASWGGGWAGVKADGETKSGLTSTTDLSIWIR